MQPENDNILENLETTDLNMKVQSEDINIQPEDHITGNLETNDLNMQDQREDLNAQPENENISENLETNDLNMQAKREYLNMQSENDSILEKLETVDSDIHAPSEDLNLLPENCNILGYLETIDLNMQAQIENMNAQPENDNLSRYLETNNLIKLTQSEDLIVQPAKDPILGNLASNDLNMQVQSEDTISGNLVTNEIIVEAKCEECMEPPENDNVLGNLETNEIDLQAQIDDLNLETNKIDMQAQIEDLYVQPETDTISANVVSSDINMQAQNDDLHMQPEGYKLTANSQKHEITYNQGSKPILINLANTNKSEQPLVATHTFELSNEDSFPSKLPVNSKATKVNIQILENETLISEAVPNVQRGKKRRKVKKTNLLNQESMALPKASSSNEESTKCQGEQIVKTNLTATVDKQLKSKKTAKTKQSKKINKHSQSNTSRAKPTLKVQKKKRNKIHPVTVYESGSSSDEIPLKVMAKKQSEQEIEEHSDNDASYKPSALDANSSDSEFSSNISDTEKSEILENKKLQKQWDKTVKALGKKSVSKSYAKSRKDGRPQEQDRRMDEDVLSQPRNDDKQTQLKSYKDRHGAIFALVEKAKAQSQKESEQRQKIIDFHYKKIDQLLFSNGLQREAVPPHGNCFFEAATISLSGETEPRILRATICKHLEENVEEYIGFLFNKYAPADEELFLTDYLSEIESMKNEGFWSTHAGDLLPLALSNWSDRVVKIYTSNAANPIIDIQPTMKPANDNTEPIYLAYISCPGTLEHYDGCKQKLPALQSTFFTYPSGQQTVIDAQHPCTAPHDTLLLDQEHVSEDSQHKVTAENLEQAASSNTECDFTAEPLPNVYDHSNEEEISVPLATSQGSDWEANFHKDITPRKSAMFVTPIKKKLSRKRKATPGSWKKNVRKQLRLSGKEYKNTSGRITKEKSIEPTDCSNCKFKCSTHFVESELQNIFDSFWSLNSYERQKDYVCARIEEKKTKSVLSEDGDILPKRKMVYRSFSFEVDGKVQSVCKKFFMSTLAIGKAYIDHAMKGKSEGRFKGLDRRGKHKPSNKMQNEKLDSVRLHIESFPKVEAHYVRKDTKREFLGPDLSLPRMYDLYKEKCAEESEEPVKISMYRKVFNEEYNFSFHVPKKDQCNTCTQYFTAVHDQTSTDELKALFEKHQERKRRARQEKDNDKILAKTSNTTFVATFDLQSVLYTPCSLVSLMYYMRNLCCYNLSVYSLGNNRGTCYVWSEVEGKRGSCEVATCLQLHLLSLPMNIDQVILYSDACGGQNRNQIIATCLLNAVTSIEHIRMIDHKFLESGHTHMECDSMHSAIEYAKKKTPIFIPSQWDTVIHMARRRDPYTVVPLKHEDIIDYKEVQTQKAKSVKYTDVGKKVYWNKVRWMRFVKEDPDNIQIKYDFDDEFEMVKFFGKKRGQQVFEGPLPRKYSTKIPISAAKKKDLLQLCKTKVVPAEFHDYYKSLPANQTVTDRLPEPDALEDDDDTDAE